MQSGGKKIKRMAMRKSSPLGTVFLFLFLSLLMSALLVAILATVMVGTVEPMLTGSAEEMDRIVSAFESDGSKADAFGRDYFILDENGEYKALVGEDTCEREHSVPYTNFGRPDTGAHRYAVYADEETEKFFPVLPGDRSFEDVMGEWLMDFYGREGIRRLVSGEAPAEELPFWFSADLKNGSRLFVSFSVSSANSAIREIGFLTLGIIGAFAIIILVMFINSVNNIINRRRMLNLFFTDTVTGGRNYNWFLVKGEPVISSYGNRKKSYAVLCLGFEKYLTYSLVNGTAEGEKVLCDAYRAIKKSIGRGDLCVRANTSDFAVLTRIRDGEDVGGKMDLIIKVVSDATAYSGLACRGGAYPIYSVRTQSGRALPRKDADLEGAFNGAVAARETLRELPGTRAALFDAKMMEEQMWENKVLDGLGPALANEEFIVYYQPKYAPGTDTLRGAEALIRWQSPEYGFVTPYRFIPIYEKNGLIPKIDHYMIDHVARDLRRWLDMGYSCVPVSVNVSRIHFAEPDLAEQIRDMADKYGTPHELLEIELTESAFFDDKKAMLYTIGKLKEYGFSVSMDDFGSGYSSLNSLKDMPLDVLKLDADFFRGDMANDRGRIVVAEAIKLAKSLNMRTVAEGVEERSQVDFLAGLDCDMIQGYYYAKPMPGEEFESRMSMVQSL